VVVLNTWASWCPPCRAEAPDLRRAAEAKAGKAQFVGINIRDNPPAARAFVRTYRIPYPSLVDDGGSILMTLGDIVPAQAIPSTIVLDRQGRVAARVIGQVRYSTLVGLVEDVLAEESGNRPGSRPDSR
jgi:thiol-disulfide isomerase/thioredoxin